jgi:hypothetical protein
MGFNFRRSIRLAPGLRINFGKRGTSVSLGGRGVTTNINKKGYRTTLSIPGTGASYSTSRQPFGGQGGPQSISPTAKKVLVGVFFLVVIYLLVA